MENQPSYWHILQEMNIRLIDLCYIKPFNPAFKFEFLNPKNGDHIFGRGNSPEDACKHVIDQLRLDPFQNSVIDDVISLLKRNKLMATSDLPGSNPANGDVLNSKCWAENPDGSLLFVDDTEGGRIIFTVFDLSKNPVVEYRDALSESDFKTRFTKGKDKWIWHDKSNKPWDKVINAGAQSGLKHPSIDDAIKVAEEMQDTQDRVMGRKRDTSGRFTKNDEIITKEERDAIINRQPETAADRLSKDLGLQAMALDPSKYSDKVKKRVKKALKHIRDTLSEAIKDLK